MRIRNFLVQTARKVAAQPVLRLQHLTRSSVPVDGRKNDGGGRLNFRLLP